jgi:hypothetical protein
MPGFYANYIMSRLHINLNQLLDKWRLEWDNHHKEVAEYFKGREEDLLIFNMEKDDPQKIVEFLKNFYTLDKNKYAKTN